ncbi:MAG: hypothetical protein JJT94_15460 [Bernardetiaceae bacterium]|nr:hypothetical protein [Bernardetiaceae bacterium]
MSASGFTGFKDFQDYANQVNPKILKILIQTISFNRQGGLRPSLRFQAGDKGAVIF